MPDNNKLPKRFTENNKTFDVYGQNSQITLSYVCVIVLFWFCNVFIGNEAKKWKIPKGEASAAVIV